jgi:hypothetical protein
MKIDFSIPLLDLYDTPLKLDEKTDLTLGTAACEALLSTYQGEDNLSGNEKADRWAIAITIKRATAPVEVTTENIAKLKDLIGKRFPAIVVGQAFEILEGRKVAE